MSDAFESRKELFRQKVTHERALEAAQALINSHFGNSRNGRTARTCVPADPNDDDLVIIRYIEQQAALAHGQATE